MGISCSSVRLQVLLASPPPPPRTPFSGLIAITTPFRAHRVQYCSSWFQCASPGNSPLFPAITKRITESGAPTICDWQSPDLPQNSSTPAPSLANKDTASH